MDTNLFNTLQQMGVFAPKQTGIDTQSVMMMVTMILATVSSLFNSWLQTKSNKIATDNSTSIATNSASLEKVHTAVNSGHDAMVKEQQLSTAEILRLSKELSGLKEKVLAQEQKDAIDIGTAKQVAIETAKL